LIITLFPYYLLNMPSSPPNPPAPSPDADTKVNDTLASGWATAGVVIGVLFAFLWSFGAASLSYAKYGSIGWAILDFFFATLYYPFYALVLNTPSSSMASPMVGGRSLRWLRKLF
jgi:hypothetical protein